MLIITIVRASTLGGRLYILPTATLTLHNHSYALASPFRHWPDKINSKVHIASVRLEQD